MHRISMLTGRRAPMVNFPIESLLDNSITDFDLFIEVQGHLVLYAGLDYKWQRQELTALLSHGYKELFMRPEDALKAKAYIELARLPRIDETMAPKERILVIERIGADLVQHLFHGEITVSAVRKAEDVADSISRCVLEDPDCIRELRGLSDHDQYTYGHSVRVAAYAVAVALQMGASEAQHLREIAMGGIFHDVGKRQVPLTVLNKTGPLSTNEWEVMRRHPSAGFQSVTSAILSPISQEIVLHHHEKLDGSGYPDRLDKGSLLYEVQIAGLADVYDALTSTRAYQNKRTRFEALDFIKHNLLGTKIASDPFKALILSLAA